ncbi:MAG: hypothetical protein PHF86_10285 [Candidatus Nanoarchaeia archaeon]|nr:hypothetical protein [Candidatus Nanoarchaeia archaeon]
MEKEFEVSYTVTLSCKRKVKAIDEDEAEKIFNQNPHYDDFTDVVEDEMDLDLDWIDEI